MNRPAVTNLSLLPGVSRLSGRMAVAPLLCMLISLIAVLGGCAARGEPSVLGGKGDPLRSEASGSKELLTINSLVVARAQVARGLQVDVAKVDRFNQLVIDQFTTESGIDVLSEKTPTQGRTKGADATLHTEITRFAEGKGSALGATTAALFAATFSIVRSSDQREIWSSTYFSTEQPDSVNLIEVTQRIGREKREGIASADSLARAAARSAALDFSRRRVEQFSRK